MNKICVKNSKILIAHSNSGQHLMQWHNRRERVARDLGYQVKTLAMSKYHPYTIFPYLDRKWQKRDSSLMRLYEILGREIADCDIFIHYNGALIHPEFMAQFNKLKIYHCADDPEASDVLSRPVARAYDIHAISNPTCIDLYRSWGCKYVFCWPLGALHYSDNDEYNSQDFARDIGLCFVGSKYGVTRWRYVHKIPILRNWNGLYTKKAFLERIEGEIPDLVAYGGGWKRGQIDDGGIPTLYRRTRLGLNLHNEKGAHNARLFDLVAFGVCQICDNKRDLHRVFTPGKEIIGYDSASEALELIRYYLAHQAEAEEIASAGRDRFLRDYTMSAIWQNFFEQINNILLQRQTTRGIAKN